MYWLSPPSRRALAYVACFAQGLLLGCSGSISGNGTGEPGDTSNGATAGSGPTGGGGGGAGGPNEDRLDPVEGLRCKGGRSFITPAGHDLARLTPTQFSRSVHALLGQEMAQGLDLDFGGASAKVHGFENFEAQNVSDSLLAKLDQSTFDLGQAAKGRVQQLAPCSASDETGRLACGKSFVNAFGKKAFRRPLTEDEQTRWQAFFDAQLKQAGYEQAVGALVEAFLMSPQFLYRIERGEPIEGHEDEPIRRLTPFELATRLAYTLTEAPPDQALIKLAEDGSLAQEDVLREQAQRLIQSPAGDDMAGHFHEQWLHLDELHDLTREHDLVAMNDEIEAALKDGMNKFVGSIWSEGGGLGDLFTAPHAFVNKLLAPIYDTDTTSTSLERVDFDGDRRAGLLTQAGWLAQHAHQQTDSPIFRGYFVTDRLLCDPPPPVPDGLMVQFPEVDPNAPAITTRQRTQDIHQSVESCGACHAHFDLYGFAFGHYDNVGRWRDQERVGDEELPLDVQIDVTATRDLNGKVDGARELGQKLAQSQQVAQCVATQWFRFAYGRTEADADACALEGAVNVAAKPDASLKDIALAIVTSEAFRHIPVTE